MTKKSMIFGVVLAMFSASLAAGLTIYGSYMFLPAIHADAAAQQVTPVGDAEVHFVDVKNIVITLTNNGRASHFMLLDLAVTTDSLENVERIENSIALIRSSTVNLLTNSDYETLNRMHVGELRQKLSDEYRSAYASLNMRMPFNDVMVSKMVFQ